MQIAQARPPFVEFKRVAVRDVRRSEELGRHVTKDVDFAFVMQPGSKDVVERVAADWLAMLKRKAMDGAPDAYPQEWIDGFHNKYKAWQDGLEAPTDGTSVREWPVLSPAQVENFIALRIMTIEDIAAMTEQALANYGMGGRELRDKARQWLQEKDVAEHLKQENAELKTALADLQAKVEALMAQSDVQADKPRRGRKPKAEEPETVE